MSGVSIYAGMSTDQLHAALTAAQKALIDLQTGQKGVSFSYAQGDGAKSVTYDRTSVSQLTQLIRDLQRELGLCVSPRRPIHVIWR